MEFRLLGPLEVLAGGGPLPVGRRKQRALLALLLLNANRVVARDRLIDDLWGDDPPETAPKALQVYVSQLRKLMPAGMLVRRPPGYVLVVPPEAVDLLRFEQLVAAAHAAEPRLASGLLHEALALWRGPPLAEFAGEPFGPAEAARLEELRLATLEERIEVDLALGRHDGLVTELETLVAEHPHRERLRQQLMLALYRSGRQAEALGAYGEARDALDELGIEPGAGLRGLERQILVQDAALDLSRPIPLPGPLVPESPFPFVGRAHELAALRASLERTEQGEGGVVLVAAEAGGGKTRLVRELAHEAGARGALVLYGASDAVVSTPYGPLREWLEFLERAVAAETLAAWLGDDAGPLSRLVPELGGTAAPESDGRAVQTAAAEALARLGRVRPVLAVADDLHWADVETLELLRRLARIAPESRLLVVAAYRDRGEELTPAFGEMLAELSRLDATVRLSLGRLSENELDEFGRASSSAEAPGGLAATIGALTGGTPLLVCELWRDLRDSGAVEVTEGGVRLTHTLDELRGPERLRDVVRQRLARLTPEAAAALDLAAVAGPRFELRVIADAAALDARGLAVAVGELIGRGLLEALPGPAAACRFTHELVRRAVYDRIAYADRATLHLRVGEALEAAHATELTRVLSELAHHFTLAAPIAGVERAVDYNLRAAGAAMSAAALEEAASRLATALELGIAEPRERARVQVELAHLLYDTGRTRESDAMLAASLNAATGLGERGVAARALVDRLGHRTGDPSLDGEELRAVAAAAVATLDEVGDLRHLAAARVYLGIALQRLGRRADSVREFERALVDAEAASDAALRRRAATGLGASIPSGPMPVPEAIRRFEELRAASGGDGVFEAVVERALGRLLAMAGRFDEALDLVRRSGLTLDALDRHSGHWVYSLAAADARELAGDLDGAEQELLACWRSYREFGHHAVDQRAMHAAYLLAFHYCDRGRWDEASQCIAFGADVQVMCPSTPAALRPAVRARLAARAGRHEEALTLARSALDCVARTDDLNLRARVLVAAAEVQRAAGDTAGADASVAEALRLYETKGNVAAVAALR